MKIDDVIAAALTVFPESVVETDLEGQLVVYTNLRPAPDRDGYETVVSIDSGEEWTP